MRLKEIVGLLPEKEEDKSEPEWNDAYSNGFNSAIDTIGERAIGLDREKLAKIIFRKKRDAEDWKTSYYSASIEEDREWAYDIADAILANLKDIVVVNERIVG